MTPETVLDMFLKFRKEGLSLEESRDQFEIEQWNEAVYAALLDDHSHPLWKIAMEVNSEESHNKTLETQCYELWMAGWVTEDNGRKQSWAWYWRRPPIGNRKKGKLFLSTNQAFNALKK